MRKLLQIVVLALGVVACNPNSSDNNIVPPVATNVVDIQALNNGADVPAEFKLANNVVRTALVDFNATLTPEVVKAYGGRLDLVLIDMQGFVEKRVEAVNKNARVSAGEEPSAAVNAAVNNLDNGLNTLEAAVDNDKVDEANSKAKTTELLAAAYNAAKNSNLPAEDKNSLMGSTYSANDLTGPTEDILKKLESSNPNGRTTGFWKKFRKAVISFVRHVVISTVKSFAKGCLSGVIATGTPQGCVAAGVATASKDLSKNATVALTTAATKLK